MNKIKQRLKRKDQIEAFLEAFVQTGSISKAARQAKVHRVYHFRWLKTDAKYVEAFAQAKQLAGGYLETALFERAITGWGEPVYYQGKKCGTVQRFSDGAAMFLLRGLFPDKYAQKTTIQANVSGQIDLVERIKEARRRVIEMRAAGQSG